MVYHLEVALLAYVRAANTISLLHDNYCGDVSEAQTTKVAHVKRGEKFPSLFVTF